MNIEYQKVLNENLSINGKTARGIDSDKIQQLETETGHEFPKSYKEFLILAGDYFPCGVPGGISGYGSLNIMQEKLKSELKEYEFSLSKECWVVEALHGEQFILFFWDEGEDPPIYVCSPCYVQDGKELLIKDSESLSEYINHSIKSA